MTVFNQQRLTQRQMQLDVERIRQGYYSDQYFRNVVTVLEGAHKAGLQFVAAESRPLPLDPAGESVGDMVVEVQVFHRRAPHVIASGVDAALAILRHGTGYYDDSGRFVETWQSLEVDALYDGALVEYGGDPSDVKPVLRIRGRYRDFALLETAILGVLSHATRVTTNVYNLLEVCNGKSVLFFPARFDLPEVQMLDGYAYWVAVQRYNHFSKKPIQPIVSTEAQGAWWGGKGGGTIPHALIATFLGDTVAAMKAYAAFVPVEMPRILLSDFNNDTVTDSVGVLKAYWDQYRVALESGDEDGQRRWTLHGVRLDTSANVRDKALEPDGPYGTNPVLVQVTRDALDSAWQAWDVPTELLETAQAFCKQVQIVVSGGFNRGRIAEYEAAGVPVDVYGVGSHFLRNDSETNTDYTMDVVRVKVQGQWVDMAKVGRQANDNSDLVPVDLQTVE